MRRRNWFCANDLLFKSDHIAQNQLLWRIKKRLSSDWTTAAFYGNKLNLLEEPASVIPNFGVLFHTWEDINTKGRSR